MGFSKVKALVLSLVVLLLILPTVIHLTKPGFFPTHDFIYVARISQYTKVLFDGQFPVRWSPDFRYGDPTFNYYAPLPYLLGALAHGVAGFSLLDTAKLLFGLSLGLSFLTMFVYAEKKWDKWIALVVAACYLYAPYRSVDVYVRGTLNEAWGFVFFPLIFLTIDRIVKRPKDNKNIALGAISLALLYITHNLVTMMFMPFVLGYVLLLLFMHRFNKQITLALLQSFFLSFLLGAFYLLPAFLEKKYIQTSFVTDGYFNFAGHFVAVKQWFERSWGYGASLWGPVDDLSFQLSLGLWLGIGVSMVTTMLRSLKTKKIVFEYWGIVFLFVFSLFMQHNLSTFIWKAFPLLAFSQFPWRFLTVSVFFASLLVGYGLSFLKNKPKLVYLVGGVLMVASILGNVGYFVPKEYYLDSIDAHYSGDAVYQVNDKIPKDYLPIWVKIPEVKTFNEPVFARGSGIITDYKHTSVKHTFKVVTNESGVLIMPVTYFPGWRVNVDGEVEPLSPSDNGLIEFSIPTGNHQVEVHFSETPVRLLADCLSILGLSLLGYLLFSKRAVPKLGKSKNKR